MINKNKMDKTWAEEICGIQLTEENADQVAEIIGGKRVGDCVSMPIPHGEYLVRKGDWVGYDATGRWKLIRFVDGFDNELVLVY